MNRNYIYRDINAALPHLMTKLLSDGDEVGSRAGRTKELTHVGITLREPHSREILLPTRKANIAAQIAETMWVLAGRNDLEFLSHYLPRAKDFSDDGTTWRAGYGARLRNWTCVENRTDDHGAPYLKRVDQLADCVRTLQESALTRQAVMSIWDPATDYDASKDIPCLAGETLLWSPEGDLPIEQVAAKFSSGEVTRWPVYAVDPVTRQQRITWATDVWRSGTKSTIKLNFDDGSILRVTPDHRLYVKRWAKSGKLHGRIRVISEILAGELKPGDKLLATHRMFGPKGYEAHKIVLDKNTGFSNQRATHRAYAELLYGLIPDEHDVHHINENKTDNRAINLEVLPHGEHAALNMLGDDNPMRRMPEDKRKIKGKKHSAALTGRTHSEETKRKMSASAIRRHRAPEETLQPDNHVVVSIEDGGVTPVYDFTVPGEHTALVGTGVVAHNCNDWLSFSNRLGKMDLHVAIRSNDAMWGWSGINAFEWSALLEIVAVLCGVEVGALHFSVTSFHLYDQHWEKAGRIATDQRRAATEPSPGFSPIVRSLAHMDHLIKEWFIVEEAIRTGMPSAAKAVNEFPEPMFRSWLRVLQWWHGDSKALDPLNGTALQLAAQLAVQSVREEKVEDNFIDYVMALHTEKDKAYGNSWRRRGEMLGIMANIARKIDRLGKNGGGDTATDTAIDTLVYLAKYRVWLTGDMGKADDARFANAEMFSIDSRVTAGDVPPALLEERLTQDFIILEKEVTSPTGDRELVLDRMLVDAYDLAWQLWHAQG